MCFDNVRAKNYKFDFRINLAPVCQASFAAKLVKNEVNWLLKLEKKEDVGKIPRISLHLSFVRIIDIWHLHQFQIFSLLLRISNPQLFKPDRFAFMKTAKFVNKALAVASSTLANLFTRYILLWKNIYLVANGVLCSSFGSIIMKKCNRSFSFKSFPYFYASVIPNYLNLTDLPLWRPRNL